MKPTKEAVSENVGALKEQTGWSYKEISRRSKSAISDHYVGDVIKGEFTLTVEKLDALAVAFGVTVHELITTDDRIKLLLRHYDLASEEGKGYIERIAQKEAMYPKEEPPTPPERPRFTESERPKRQRRKKST